MDQLDSTLIALRSVTQPYTPPPTAPVYTPSLTHYPHHNHSGSLSPPTTLQPATPQPQLATPQPLPATPQPTIIASPPPSPFPEPHWPELHFEVISDDEEEAAAEDKLTSLPYPLARTPMNGLGWELLWRQGFRGGGLGKNLQGRMEPVTRTNRVAGDRSGLGYDGEDSRLEGSIMVFVKAGELKNKNTSSSTEVYTPHFTPSDLANLGLSHLIQWPSNTFAWEGVANAGIPLKPSSNLS